MKPNVYKKRKTSQKTKKPFKNYIKKDKLNPWAPKISLKEYKYFDNLVNSVTITTATLGGQINWLNQSGVGNWAVNRIGNKIIMKSIHFQAILSITGVPQVVPLYPNVLRFVLVYDKFPNGGAAPATLSEVFQAMAYQGTTETSVFSGVNISNRERFIILRDYKRYTPRVEFAQDGQTPIYHGFTGQGALGQGSEKSGQSFLIDDYIKLNLPTVYKVNSTQTPNDFTNIETGALLLYSYCGSQSGNWVITHGSRIVWKEESTN